jgi:hypothetical protein
MHRGLAPLLLAALTACNTSVPSRDPHAFLSEPPTILRDRGEAERLAGTTVYLDGRLESDRNIHARLILDSGLVVYVPRFHEFAVQHGWKDWHLVAGRRVRVAGRLHGTTQDVSGWDGPSVDIDRFDVWP